MSSSSHRWILIGPIGSGKSTVGEILRERGITVVDADRIGHEILEPDGPAFGPVSRRWPEALHRGRVDRRALGRIVFSDPDQLRELESMTHPHIRRRIEELSRDTPGVLVVEISVLADLAPEYWPTVVVDAPDDVRVARLLARGMEYGEVLERMEAQPPRQEWVEKADIVIDNSGLIGDTIDQVDKLLLTRPGVGLLPGNDPQEREHTHGPE